MKGRFFAQLMAVVATVVALSVVFFRLVVDEPAPLVTPPSPQPVPNVVAPQAELPAAAVVASVAGVVERSSGEGDWRRVAQGERLEVNAALRTGTNSAAELQVGDSTRFSAGADTEVGVVKLGGDVQTFRLIRGRLAAAVDRSKGRVVRIENQAGAAVETTSAKFAVMNSGQVLAVATDAGGATLTAGGTTVEVGPGEVAFAEAGRAPTVATPLPKELVLKVARAQPPGKGLCATVEGMATLGAEVRVAGELVPVTTDGRFRVQVPRQEGRTDVLVTTRDVSGRTREERVACALELPPGPPQPSEPPLPKVSGIKVKWDGSKPR